MTREELMDIIFSIRTRENISNEILEKDYYVCLILRELSKKQEELKAYFKGGTAVYKILNTMNRFSEDIDLTVKVIETDSKTSNINRLKKSVLGYNIPTLKLIKEETIDRKGSITSFYSYDSLFQDNRLFKQGKIQIESTSFTVSEPIKKYNIEPLIYKFATDKEKEILKNTFDVSNFDIEIISLERIFIDKIFAIEFYYIRKKYKDVAKHLYDITILFECDDIKKFLDNKEELKKLISYKRKEEEFRIGGIDKDIKLSNFKYMNEKFNNEIVSSFMIMQNTYVFDDKYKVSMDKVIKVITILKDILASLDNK